MNKKYYLLILINIQLSLIINASLIAQNVLDAPFILEKEVLYSPEPLRLNNYNLEEEFGPWTKEERTALDQNHIYMESYVFSEFKYSRVRVYRYVGFNKNEHFSNKVEYSKWVKTKDQNWNVYSDEKSQKKISQIPKPIFNIHVPYWIQYYDQVNLKNIREDTSNNNEKYLLRNYEDEIKKYKEKGAATENKDGFFIVKENYEPDSIEIIAFQQFILKAFQDNLITGYNEKEFQNPITYSLWDKGNAQKNIKGIRIEEDYYIDERTGNLTSRIIGLGLVSEDTIRNKELLWLYYPELRWAWSNYCSIYRNQIINYEYLLDNHLYKGKIEEIKRIGTLRNKYDDSDFMVKLDAILTIKLHREENNDGKEKLNGIINYSSIGELKKCQVAFKNDIANGKMVEYYNNGQASFTGNLLAGKCNGDFIYYYDTGVIKAKRHFELGKLVGDQTNYWPNKQVYSQFSVINDEPTILKRWYDDGKLFEVGSFEDGIMIGEWQYHIKFPEEVLRILKLKNGDTNLLPGFEGKFDDKNTFDFKVLYTHERKDYCPFLTGICLNRQYIK